MQSTLVDKTRTPGMCKSHVRGVQNSSVRSGCIIAPSAFLSRRTQLEMRRIKSNISSISRSIGALHSQGRVGVMNCFYYGSIDVPSTKEAEITDITEALESIISNECIEEGLLTVQSMHTTCGLVVNENEFFLKDDLIKYFSVLAPSDGEYKHNDLAARPATERDRESIVKNNFGGFASVEEFMKAEPKNAHAHIQSILCGNSVTMGVAEGKLVRGQWQSVLFCDFDGPRANRKANVTIIVAKKR